MTARTAMPEASAPGSAPGGAVTGGWSGPDPALLPLLYLAGQTLPVGGFAWSQGLEAAVEQGLAGDAAGLRRWLAGVLHYGLARNDLPLLLRLHRAAMTQDATGLRFWNDRVLASRESAELWQEEVQMGRALRRLLTDTGLLAAAGPLPGMDLPDDAGYTACFAAAAALLQTRAAKAAPTPGQAASFGLNAACAYAWSWLQNQTAVACKTVPLGQTAAQKLLLEFLSLLPQEAAQAAALDDTAVGASLPGLALCSAAHERQYSRLFRS
ncbi:urease accessory protein UreF [uncultured Desulfovibrio sp.]|uniref:urease accessory protein UreF n=1 Tax=uncultured Desulfovibrio sp. TaxID=167968 RepID=UPI00220291B3|nr:urease accessory UreF family protein [uncultured Desulfovibrio sp.]CAI3239210.1 hypothetical protein DWUX_2067 [Desulfovibrio diazotrophicus]